MEEQAFLNTATSKVSESNLNTEMDTETKIEEDEEMSKKKKKYVTYLDPDSAFDKLQIRTELSIYDVGTFQVAEGTVAILLDMWLIYDTKLFNDTFGNTRSSGVPWVIPNALELDVAENDQYYMQAESLDKVRPFLKRQRMNKDAASMKSFTIEIYTIRATLKLITFPAQDPFQNIFLPIKLCFDGTPGSEMAEFITSKGDFYFMQNEIGAFKKGDVVVRAVRNPVDYGGYECEYVRQFYIIEFYRSPLEDIIKFYVLPFLVNALTIGFYDSVDSLFDSTGAYFLAIVALLFVLPDNGAFTRNEKAIVFASIWMLVILFILVTQPSVTSQTILWICLSVSYAFLLMYDVIMSRRINKNCKEALWNGDVKAFKALGAF